MAKPSLLKSLVILMGDGATPTETFAFPCGATTRSVKFTNNLGEDVVLDCDNPDTTAAAIERWIESQDTSLSIAGRVAKEHWAKWREFIDGQEARNFRIEVPLTAAQGGGYWLVPMLPSDFEMGKEGKATVAFTLELAGAGPRVWTDAAA